MPKNEDPNKNENTDPKSTPAGDTGNDSGATGAGNEDPKDEDVLDKAAIAELKAKAAEAEKYKSELNKYQQEKAAAEKAAKEAEMTAEQKLAEAQRELQETKRHKLIGDVRLKKGYTDPIFDAFKPDGETEDEIDSFYAARKKDIDAYVEKQKKPNTPVGGPTQNKEAKPATSNVKGFPSARERHGFA